MLALLGCASDSVDPNVYHGDGTPASADRTLVLASCQAYTGYQTGLPCTTYSTGTGTKRVDSARVVLRRDFTASWMAGETDHYNTCGQPSCSSTTTLVESGDGTYQILADTIFLTLTLNGSVQHRSLWGTFPAGIDSHWPGPDSLIVAGYTPTYTTLIFRPQ